MSDPVEIDDLKARVGKALTGFLSARYELLDAVSEELGPMADAAALLTQGGKGLRSAFCYWGFRGAGGADGEPIVAAAAALELLHACALVHDDVMDGSDTRRGRPAAHRGFATLHRSGGWTGDPESFGTAAAILLGDLCLAWADELLTASGLPEQSLQRGRRVFDRMRTELMAGQYLDLLEQARGGGSVERARRVIRYKSAGYTVTGPLLLGCALAGGDAALDACYTALGTPLGEAFQLRDDLLGVFGDPAETGKPAGDDLREGKRTVLVAHAATRADGAQRELLRRHLGDPHLTGEGLAALRLVLTETGAVAEVEQQITDLTREAHAALAAAAVPADVRSALAALVVATTRRTR